MPTVPELLKQKLKVQKLSKPKEGGGREVAGDLKMKDVLEIAKQKGGGLPAVKMVLGTCQSCGVTVEGKQGKQVIAEINGGRMKVE